MTLVELEFTEIVELDFPELPICRVHLCEPRRSGIERDTGVSVMARYGETLQAMFPWVQIVIDVGGIHTGFHMILQTRNAAQTFPFTLSGRNQLERALEKEFL